jgi:hypothetical protein
LDVGLTVGKRLRAQNSSCEVIVIKGADGDDVLACAGVEMLESAASGGDQVSAGPRVEVGKRYTVDAADIEVLCTKAGVGPLSYAGQELLIKAAKSLPASD